jgi:transcriptional regulator with XRE-family HTH domain
MPLYLRIAYCRERKGWSQAQLARASGVNQSVISRIESGETQSIHLQNPHQIAKALEVPAPALLVEED